MLSLLSNYAAVIALIALLHDGEKGFHTLSEHVREPSCRRLLLQEAFLRASFAGELESVLSSLVQEPIQESGTAIGTAHRRWLELKASLGAGMPGMLHSLQTCESSVAEAYDLALSKQDLDPSLRALIKHQSDYVRSAYKGLQHLCGVTEN